MQRCDRSDGPDKRCDRDMAAGAGGRWEPSWGPTPAPAPGGHGREERATATPRRGEDRLPLRDPRGCRCPLLPWPRWAGLSSSQEPEPTSLSSVLRPPTPRGCQAGTHSTMGVLGPRGSQQGEQDTAPRASSRGLGVPPHSHRGLAGRQGGCGTRSHQGDNRNKYGEGAARARPQPQPRRGRAPRPGDGGWLWRCGFPWSWRRAPWRVTVRGEARPSHVCGGGGAGAGAGRG